MLRAIRGIEVINGGVPRVNLMHEFNYSLALDNGFRVSPVASSDSHGPVWGFGCITPKTVILAPEKSREAFIDALRNNRFYATESGNVKLKYTVNGKSAPADLDDAVDYLFSVELSYFREDETSVPVSCSVISDGGKTLFTTSEISNSFSFSIHAESARYFYLRFVDSNGHRTWSMPVWTGRAFDKYEEPSLTPINLSEASAYDVTSGIDAPAVIDGDAYNTWEGKGGTASIVIDLKEAQSVSALGYYPRIIERPTSETPKEIRASWREENLTSTLPTSFAIYTSLNGEGYEKRAEGVFRIFGGESIITFEPTTARYVRLDILSTTGKDTYPALWGNAKCSIGNISLFK